MRELYKKLNRPLPEINEDNSRWLYQIVEEAFVNDFWENQRSEIDDEIVSDYIKFIRSNYAFYQNVPQWTDAYLDKLVRNALHESPQKTDNVEWNFCQEENYLRILIIVNDMIRLHMMCI